MALGFSARLAYVWISGRSYMSNLMSDFDFDFVHVWVVKNVPSPRAPMQHARGSHGHSDCIRDSGVLCLLPCRDA